MVHTRRRRASVLLTVLFCVGLLFGWASPSWAEPVRFEAETVCTDGYPYTLGATPGLSIEGDGAHIECTVTVPTGGGTVAGWGFAAQNPTPSVTVTIDGAAGPAASLTSGSSTTRTEWFVTSALTAGSHVVRVTCGSCYNWPNLDYLDVEPTAAPSPSPSPEASPAVPPPADTGTATIVCGTQDDPCVQALQEWQYLSFMLFAGTGLLLSMVTFFRREGAALDA